MSGKAPDTSPGTFPGNIPANLLEDDSGQATTEYILLLAIAVGLATIVIRDFLRPAFAQLTEKLTRRLERGFFGDMHHFPVRR